MRTISIPKTAKMIGSGSFGTYYRLNKKRGIKVLWHTRIDTAMKEAKYLNMAAKIKLAPRCHEVVKVSHILGWTNYGLIVDHIDGKASGWRFTRRRIMKNKEQLSIYKALLNIGIKNTDLCGNNVRRTKTGFKVVDFTPHVCVMTK